MALIYNATFDSGTRILSLLDKAGNVISSCEVPSKSNELTFKATADNSSVKLTKNGTLDNTYEVNTGNGWEGYTFGTVIPLNAGQSCKWRCSAHPTTQSLSNYVRFVMTGKIEASGNCNSMLSSDFENLTSLSGYDCAFYNLFSRCASLTQAPSLPATILATSCYHNMFAYCSSLTRAPELPAMTLAPECYNSLFFGCSSLTQVPELPATDLAPAHHCYSFMFAECTALTRAPELPATTLGVGCYTTMFRKCTSLIQPPELPATTLDISCYSAMFKDCHALKKVRIAATKTATNALKEWLSGVSATGDFYCDPSATIFPTDSSSGIPKGWTRHNINTLKALTLTATADNSSVRLTKNGTLDNTFEVDKGNGWEDYAFGTVIPLNAGESCKWRCTSHSTTQSDQNYVQFVMTGKIEASGNVNSMLSSGFENLTSLSGYDYAFRSLFKGCTSLTQAPQLPATTLAVDCYGRMFEGCTSLTKAPSLPATALARNCYVFMFYGCTSLTQAPALPATTLAEYCYGYMFNDCTSLTIAPSLPATALARNCYEYMFEGCTSLTQAPALPATTLAEYCYSFMFYGCTSLVQAPELQATTLANFCYDYMFTGCTPLNEVRIAATKTATGALDFWLAGVSATGDFYCNPNATIFKTNSESGIPKGWVRHALADYPQT